MELGEGSRKSWLVAEQDREGLKRKECWMYVQKWDGTQRGQVKRMRRRGWCPEGLMRKAMAILVFPIYYWKRQETGGQGRQNY